MYVYRIHICICRSEFAHVSQSDISPMEINVEMVIGSMIPNTVAPLAFSQRFSVQQTKGLESATSTIP